MNIPLINGVQHSWASIQIEALGRVFTGVAKIAYGFDRETEDHHGAGDEPVMRGIGNKKYKNVDLTLYQFEVDGIQAAAATFGIDEIPPFPITVHYKATANSASVTNVIQNCQFLGNMRDWSQGATKGEVPLKLICAGIK